MTRGVRYLFLVRGGSDFRARFVGERDGVVWLAYDDDDFEALCIAFDEVCS